MTIGVDIDSKSIKVGIVEGGVIYRQLTEAFPNDKSVDESVATLISSIKILMNSNIKGIGIGVPSVVDAKKGIVYNVVNVPSWKEVHLKKIISKEFNVPVAINNDCNCLAFAERYYGEGTPFRNIVAVKLGAGLGAGIIVNDVLYDGWNTGAGEIGSIPYLDKDYEEYCASRFFLNKGITGKKALAEAFEGEQNALQLWNEYGWHIGNLIKVILFAYDPQAIILSGEYSKGYPFYSKKLHENLSTFPYPNTIKNMKLLISRKEDLELLGAAALIP